VPDESIGWHALHLVPGRWTQTILGSWSIGVVERSGPIRHTSVLSSAKRNSSGDLQRN
jgi:hypothetical protein